MTYLNPFPISPDRFSFGTIQSSNKKHIILHCLNSHLVENQAGLVVLGDKGYVGETLTQEMKKLS